MSVSLQSFILFSLIVVLELLFGAIYISVISLKCGIVLESNRSNNLGQSLWSASVCDKHSM